MMTVAGAVLHTLLTPPPIVNTASAARREYSRMPGLGLPAPPYSFGHRHGSDTSRLIGTQHKIRLLVGRHN